MGIGIRVGVAGGAVGSAALGGGGDWAGGAGAGSVLGVSGAAVGTGTYTIEVRETGYLLRHGHLCGWATPRASGVCTCGLMEMMDVVADGRTPELEAERVAQFFGRLGEVAATLDAHVKSGDAKDPGAREALLLAERLAKEQGLIS